MLICKAPECSNYIKQITTQEDIEIVKIVCLTIIMIILVICLTILIAMCLKKKTRIKPNLIDLLKNDEKVKDAIKHIANNK